MGAQAMAAADEEDAEGGPRRVKTLVVRPDGSVMAPEPTETAAAAPAASDVETTAATPAPAPAAQMPVPAAAAPKQVAAAAAPAVEKPAAPTKYVVQVGSKKNQTDALATFADMQQKYPTLLANYRPMVQKADLGSKGTWYRLRIGPIADKSTASKLCTQLKSQGQDCLVMTQ
jgi:cell division septation protein DedD